MNPSKNANMSTPPNFEAGASANFVWTNLLRNLVTNGHSVTPRGKPTKELLCVSSAVDMNRPVVTVKERKLGYRFLIGEALWILNGDSRVATIAPFSKAIASFSDNGMYFQGAYGPMVVQQLDYVVHSLCSDPDTRQAVMTIWRPNPRVSKDIPCTISVQFLIRENKLFCLDTMRSSDTWLGWPYDIFNFSMLSAFICIALRKSGLPIEMGRILLTAGSQHLYDQNVLGACDCLDSESFNYTPFNVADYDTPQDLLKHLESLLYGTWLPGSKGFLYDLCDSVIASKGDVEERPSNVVPITDGAGDKPIPTI